MKYFILYLFSVLLISGCDLKEQETKKAYVNETRFYHWGRGYYRHHVYYEFEYDGDTIRKVFKYPTLYRLPTGNKIKEGDSLVVSFPVGKPQRSKVMKYQSMQK